MEKTSNSIDLDVMNISSIVNDPNERFILDLALSDIVTQKLESGMPPEQAILGTVKGVTEMYLTERAGVSIRVNEEMDPSAASVKCSQERPRKDPIDSVRLLEEVAVFKVMVSSELRDVAVMQDIKPILKAYEEIAEGERDKMLRSGGSMIYR